MGMRRRATSVDMHCLTPLISVSSCFVEQKEQQAELKKARLKALGLDEKGKETPKADKAGGEGSGGGGGLKGGGKGRRASMLAIDGAQEAKAREMLEGSGGGAKGNRRGSIMADIAAAGRKKKGLNAAILNGSTAGDDDDDDEGEGEGDADTLPISGLAFSEDGRYLALSTATGYLQVMAHMHPAFNWFLPCHGFSGFSYRSFASVIRR